MGREVSYPRNTVMKAYYDVSDCQDWVDWRDFTYEIEEKAKKAFPSLRKCDTWLPNEDLALLQNDFCYFGVSEYCGCACAWIAEKSLDGYYAEASRKESLANAWFSKIEKKFHNVFGNLVAKGTMSNGETVYGRKGD